MSVQEGWFAEEALAALNDNDPNKSLNVLAARANAYATLELAAAVDRLRS